MKFWKTSSKKYNEEKENGIMEMITLNLIPKGIPPVCHASQYDKGRVIRLNLVDGLQGYTLTDETVTLNVRKPDNNIVTAGVNVVSGASYVDIVITEQMTACEGENLCEIVITKGDVKIASLNFKMKVEVDPLKDGIESETEIHNLEQQIADAVRGQVSKLKSDFESDANSIVPNISQFEITRKTIWTSGKYIVPTTGALDVNASYSYTNYMEIIGNEEYIIKRHNNLYGAFYDSSFAYVGGIKKEGSASSSFSVVAPSNAKYVRLSCLTANVSETDISINKVKSLASDIIINPINIISVSKDGTKDFSSLRSAFESIVDASETNQYIVEFYGDGTEYNATSDFSSAEISSNNIGLIIPSYTTLKGIGGKEKCIIAGRLTSETTNRYFSTINLSIGANIEGFTIIGDYTRNVIHQDFGSLTDLESEVKDCHLIGSNLNLYYVLASGILSGCKYKYKNVVFENLTNGGYAYSCHNNVGFIDTAFLEFNNCRFIVASGTNDFSFRLGSINTGANEINCNCILIGCKIPVQLRLNQENVSAFGAGILWKVSGYANEIASTRIYTSDGVDYSGNIDLI